MNDPSARRRSRWLLGERHFEDSASVGLSAVDLRLRLAAVLDELEAGDAGIDAAVELLLRLLEDLDYVAAERTT
jgi:hypothetical protein